MKTKSIISSLRLPVEARRAQIEGRFRLHTRPCEELFSSAAIHLSILANSLLALIQKRKKEDGLPRRAMALLARTAAVVLLCSNPVFAEDAFGPLPPKEIDWKFDGVFGHFDKQSIQRGFKVYKEVCQVCHSLKQVSYGKLQEVGFSEAEVKSLASEYQVTDGPNNQGEMFERPATPNDSFVPPYKNENAARAANNGAYPPDLSLIIKARPNGANYVYSILTGYDNPPERLKLNPGMSYNPYFQHRQVAMPQPLIDSMVTYTDGTPATIDRMAQDVVNFLQWASEPEMEKRKVMGLKVMLYLAVFTAVFYVAKRRMWRRVK